MKRRGRLAGMVLVCLVLVSGCGVPTVQRWTIPDPFARSITTPTSPTTPTTTATTPTTTAVTPTTVPAGPVPVLCGGGTEADRPAAALLNPLLLTVSDIVPQGYISSGYDGATSSLLFGGELPLSVPVAAISYDEDSRVASGLGTDEIDEAVAQDTSASAASDLAGQLQRASAGCPDGMTVPLAGTVPGLVATTGYAVRCRPPLWSTPSSTSRAPRSMRPKGAMWWKSRGRTPWTSMFPAPDRNRLSPPHR